MSIYPLLSLRLHAWSDAAVLTVVLLIPWLGGFAGLNPPSLVLWGGVTVAWGMNLLTQYPLGVIRVLPIRVHSLVEYASGPAFIVLLPWIFRDVRVLPVLLPAAGIANLATNLLTDYRRAA